MKKFRTRLYCTNLAWMRDHCKKTINGENDRILSIFDIRKSVDRFFNSSMAYDLTVSIAIHFFYLKTFLNKLLLSF